MDYRIVNYAIIIDTGTTETLESIGMYNGKIRIISDGAVVPSYAEFEDETAVGGNWVNLFKLDGLSQAGTKIDITNGGDYAYLSGLNFTLANKDTTDTIPYHEAIQQLDQAWLIGSSVQFFIVVGGWKFIQRWEGVIDGIAFDEESFSFSASDKLIKEFKQLPAVSGDQIAIGSVQYSPLIPVATTDEETVLLESHTICRILPYGDKYASGTYAKDAIGWSASYLAPQSMDIVGFQSQKQYPTALDNSAVTKHNRRLLTPIDNRDYWVILELTVDHPEWIGKTITIDGNDHLILDVMLADIPDSGTIVNPTQQRGLWVLAKDLNVGGITTESLFGVPKSIYFANNCVNSDDANGVLDAIKSFSTEKALCTISDKLKVLQFSKDTSLTDLVTDANGNIQFFTKGADGSMVPVKVQGSIDIDNNIVIVNESKRRELVIPDRISISSGSGLGFEAKYEEPYYDPIYNRDIGVQYSDSTYFDGTDYDLRELYNGKNIYHEYKDVKCTYAISGENPVRQNNTLAENYAVKIVMEFNNIDVEQDYKPFLFLQSDYYEGQQWAATFDGADFPHKPAVLPFAKSTYPMYDTYDPAHSESGNSLQDLYFHSMMPIHQESFLSLCADVWTVNVYPVVIHEQLGYITQSGLDSEFKPVVPYTFDLPKRKTDSAIERKFIENAEYPDRGHGTKLYAWGASATYAVCTAPKELIPDNDSVGSSININYFKQWKDANDVIQSEFTIQPVTMDIIRVGDTHSEYLQTATDSGNERQWLMDGVAKGNSVNSELPVIDADTIKVATTNGVTRILFEISSEYLIDRELFHLGIHFFGTANIDDYTSTDVPTVLKDISPEVLKIMGIGLMIDEPISVGDLYVSLKSKDDGINVPTDTVYGALHYMTDTYSGLLGNYSSLPAERTNLWNVGRVIQQQQNTFNYIQELCQQSFVCGWTNRKGDINYAPLNPSFQASDADNSLVVHDNNIIIRDSISGFGLSPLSQVYNEFDIQFAYNYATGKYDKQYSVKHVDEDAFPVADASQGKQVANDSVQIIPVTYFSETRKGVVLLPTTYYVADDWKEFFIYNTFEVVGTPLNHAIWGTVTAVEQLNDGLTTKIRFDIDATKSIINQSTDLQIEGTWLSNIYTLGGAGSWKEFVVGIDDYQMAKDVWELCHSGWLENKQVNKAPTSLTDLIWATDLTILKDDRASPYDEYAYQYLLRMAKWCTRQKWQVQYDVPVNEATATLELMQEVRFNDPIITPDIDGNTQYGIGYITSIEVVPNEDIMRIGLTFEKFLSRARVPAQGVTITETGSAITITETGSAITITEQ